jgi:hypothetical protein
MGGGSQRVVVEGREIQVMVDRNTFETTPVPAWFVANGREPAGAGGMEGPAMTRALR